MPKSSSDMFTSKHLVKSNTLRNDYIVPETPTSGSEFERLSINFLASQRRPRKQSLKLTSMRRTAVRLYDNGYCRKFFEMPGTPLTIKKRRKRCVLHVTDLWGESQSKLLLKEIGFYSATAKSLSSRTSPPNEKTNLTKIDNPKSLYFGHTPALKFLRKSGEITPTIPQTKSARELTSGLDKIIADCESVKNFSRKVLKQRPKKKPEAQAKVRLKRSEMQQISYYMSSL